MDISAIIIQLRNYCPTLVSVAGAAEAEVAVEIGDLSMPAAYVIPLSQDASPNDEANSLFQIVTETFGVLVCFDNRTDNGRGQTTSTSAFGPITTALHAALLNWQIDDRCIKGVSFEGSHLVKQDRARAWYRWVYSYEYAIDASDGFQPPSDDLVVVDLALYGDIVGAVKLD